MRAPFLTFFVFLALIVGCKDNPTLPEERTGIPNALGLDNLQLIQSLEKSKRQNTWLTAVAAAGTKLDGRPIAGSSWDYIYTQINPEEEHVWDVYDDGKIVEQPGAPPIKPGVSLVDIYPLLKINSDEAIQIARQNGANRYIKKFPNTTVRLTYSYLGGRATCKLKFEQLGQSCNVDFWIDAGTGEVLAYDTSCLDN